MPVGVHHVWLTVAEVTGMKLRRSPISSVPSISFDFCYTKCVPDKSDSKEIYSIAALRMVDSASG